MWRHVFCCLAFIFVCQLQKAVFPQPCLRTVGCRSKLRLLTFRLLNHPANYSQPRRKTQLCIFPFLGRSVGKITWDFVSDKLGAVSGILIIFVVSIFYIYSSAMVLGLRWMKPTVWFQTFFLVLTTPWKKILKNSADILMSERFIFHLL